MQCRQTIYSQNKPLINGNIGRSESYGATSYTLTGSKGAYGGRQLLGNVDIYIYIYIPD